MAEIDLNNLKTVALKGIEILSVGTWHGARGGVQKYTRADLEEFAEAHALGVELGVEPTVYLGHNDEPGKLEQPAVGQIKRMYVKGRKLLADLDGVPPVVAALIQTKAYRGRSIEGFRFRTDAQGGIAIAGRQFKQFITGLALLGKNLPAVDGLSDAVGLYAALETGERGEDLSVFYAVALAAGSDPDDGEGSSEPADDEGGGLEPSPNPATVANALPEDEPYDKRAARVMAALDAIGEELIALVSGEHDAPIVRPRVRSLRQDAQRIIEKKLARLGLTQNRKEILLDKLAVALGLAKDAGAEDVLVALAAVTAGDPNTALAVIAEILGIPGAETDAVVAKVRELAGVSAPASEDMAGEPEVEMSKNVGGDSPEFIALKGQVSELLRFKAETEGLTAKERAERLVDAEVRLGKFLPAQRDTLVTLAKHDANAFIALAQNQPVVIKLGERGHSGGAEGDSYAPTDLELATLRGMGIDDAKARAMVSNQKRIAAGLEPVAEGAN